MTAESFRVLFTDLGYTVYQVFPNRPVGAGMAIAVTAEPTAATQPAGQRFTRRLVLPVAPAPAPGASLESAAEQYLRRVLDLVVHDGVRVKPDSEHDALTVLHLSRDQLRQLEQQP